MTGGRAAATAPTTAGCLKLFGLRRAVVINTQSNNRCLTRDEALDAEARLGRPPLAVAAVDRRARLVVAGVVEHDLLALGGRRPAALAVVAVEQASVVLLLVLVVVVVVSDRVKAW